MIPVELLSPGEYVRCRATIDGRIDRHLGLNSLAHLAQATVAADYLVDLPTRTPESRTSDPSRSPFASAKRAFK